MATRYSMQRRLRMNRPSLRLNSKPPKLRTPRGEDFTAANLAEALSLQQCTECGAVNYPPRELCQNCLSDTLRWRTSDTSGRLLEAVELHHSLWEFYKRRLEAASWPIATVRLVAGPVVFTHLAAHLFVNDKLSEVAQLKSGTALNVFSQADGGRQAVLISVPSSVDISTGKARTEIAREMGLTTGALRADKAKELEGKERADREREG
ncbi:MAG: Zn-ribbon domain-containing OB-fold protein [Pseudomonadales bacterium]